MKTITIFLDLSTKFLDLLTIFYGLVDRIFLDLSTIFLDLLTIFFGFVDAIFRFNTLSHQSGSEVYKIKVPNDGLKHRNNH